MEIPKQCPRCNSENIWRAVVDDTRKLVVCKHCGNSWLEHYEMRLVYITDAVRYTELGRADESVNRKNEDLISTFRLGDVVWFATIPINATDENPVILLHGVVKKVQRNGHLITVQWSDGSLRDHLANNLAFTSSDAIKKHTNWIASTLALQKSQITNTNP